MPTFSENFRPFRAKNFVSGPHLALITTASWCQLAQQRTTMVGEKGCFTKRVLGEKHISGIMRKNPGGARL